MDKSYLLLEIENIGKRKNTVRSKSEAFLILDELKKKIEEVQNELEIQLIPEQPLEFFLDKGKKVYYNPGKQKTKIQKEKLFRNLVKQERIKDFVKASTITERGLRLLKDGEQLIAAYRIEDGLGDETIKVGDISKDEKEEISNNK
jgi:hypothetical protein